MQRIELPSLYRTEARYRASRKVTVFRKKLAVAVDVAEVPLNQAPAIATAYVRGAELTWREWNGRQFRPVTGMDGKIASLEAIEAAPVETLAGSLDLDPGTLWEDHPCYHDASFLADNSFKYPISESELESGRQFLDIPSLTAIDRKEARARAKGDDLLLIEGILHKAAPLPGTVIYVDGSEYLASTWVFPLRSGLFRPSLYFDWNAGLYKEVTSRLKRPHPDLRTSTPGQVLDARTGVRWHTERPVNNADVKETLRSACFATRAVLAGLPFGKIGLAEITAYSDGVSALAMDDTAAMSANLARLAETLAVSTNTRIADFGALFRIYCQASEHIWMASLHL